MNVDEALLAVQRLEQRNRSLEEEVKSLRAQTVAMHSQAEAGEEYIALQLMKKLRVLQAEKVHLAMEVDREEEFLTNSLQRQLTLERQAKVDLENQLEAEQESIVHRLQRQIQQNTREKSELSSRLSSLDSQLIVQLQVHTAAARQLVSWLTPVVDAHVAMADKNVTLNFVSIGGASPEGVAELLAAADLPVRGGAEFSVDSRVTAAELLLAVTRVLDRLDTQLRSAVDSRRSAALASTAILSELDATRVENRALQLQLQEARASIATLSSSSSTASLSVIPLSLASGSTPSTPRPLAVDGSLARPHSILNTTSISPAPLNRPLSSSSGVGSNSVGAHSPFPSRSPRVLTPRAHPISLPPSLEALVSHAGIVTAQPSLSSPVLFGTSNVAQPVPTTPVGVTSPLVSAERPAYPRDASQPRRGTMSGHHSPARAHSPKSKSIPKIV